MRTSILLTLVFFCTAAAAQRPLPYQPTKTYPSDSLKRWTKKVLHDVSIKHPGFYRYTPKEEFDQAIDSTINTITSPLTEIELYRKLKPLIARIGCVHTQIELSPSCTEYLAAQPVMFPFDVFIDSARSVFVTADRSTEKAIPIKSEIISINGRPISEIMSILVNAVPTDGKNVTGKLLLLSYRFSFWYQTMIESASQYQIVVKANHELLRANVKGIYRSAFPTMNEIVGQTGRLLDLRIEGSTAIYTIKTFAKSAIRRGHQRFTRFTRQTFKTLQEEKVNNLVIDLRNNTGGTDANAAFLTKYLAQRPYRYWDRIEVTESIAQELKGFAAFFYCKPKFQDSSWVFTKSRFTDEFDFYQQQYPARKNVFKGRVYLLTNGTCYSSCSDFTAIASYNFGAIVAGEESGGGYQGNNSGLIPRATMETGLILTVPLLKYTNHVDRSKNLAHGTVPEIKLTRSINQEDDVLTRLLSIIHQH